MNRRTLLIVLLTNLVGLISFGQTKKPLYLNIIWHQHQPLYLDPAKDQLQGPGCVRMERRIITIWRHLLENIRRFIALSILLPRFSINLMSIMFND